MNATRDQFAMAALTGLLCTPKRELHDGLAEIAETAYRMADEMIKARRAGLEKERRRLEHEAEREHARRYLAA